MDFDKFGYCVLCGKNMLIEQVIGGKVERRFTAEHGEMEVLLDDGSRMRICMCKKCKVKVSKKDFSRIMDKVKNGWKNEIEDLKWTAEKKQKYFDRYGSLEIVVKCGTKPDDILETEIVSYREEKKAKTGGR